jgi:hypothetical protein
MIWLIHKLIWKVILASFMVVFGIPLVMFLAHVIVWACAIVFFGIIATIWAFISKVLSIFRPVRRVRHA